MTMKQLRGRYNAAVQKLRDAIDALDAATDDITDDALNALNATVDEAETEVQRAKEQLDRREAIERAREQHTPVEIPDEPVAADARAAGGAGEARVTSEPDMYTRDGHSFISDLYLSQVKGDGNAGQRIARHQAHEIQKRAITTTTLGGIIPPQYLVDLYAKAPRNGRVYAEQVDHKPLPADGMSLIVPRLTAGLATAVQATQNTAVTTQDPTEVDLTVPVVTIGGYSAVSRQALERGSYSEDILFEDLIARYQANVDTQCISGSGSAGQMLGVLNTAGVSTSTVSTATVVALYPKIADVIQQINTACGGLGYVADKIIMHPRRFGAFTAALDSSNRPLMVPSPMPGSNAMAIGGSEAAYGYTGTLLQGLPVYTDANIPTNLGVGTNEDRIIAMCSQVVHLWERPSDPVTLGFEQTAGNSLQVQLVAYGYSAFTAGRYPAASGVVSGTGLVPPTF